MPDENHITPSILRSGMALADMAVASTVEAIDLRKRIAELEAALRQIEIESKSIHTAAACVVMGHIAVQALNK